MNQRQLECFIKTVRSGSTSKAAAELYTSQPTVAYQITALESELGITLFNRGPRGMNLTDAGVRLLPHLESALRAIEQAEDTAEKIRDEQSGPVSIANYQHVHDPLFDAAIRDFRVIHPHVQIRYKPPIISEVLITPNTDVQIVAKMSDDMFYPYGASHKLLFSTWTYAIVSEKSPLAHRKHVSLHDLFGRNVVFLQKRVMERLDAWYVSPITELSQTGKLTIEYADERTLDAIEYRILGDSTSVYVSQGIHTTLADGLVEVPFSDPEEQPLEVHICWDESAGRVGVRDLVNFMCDYYTSHADIFTRTH